MFARATFGTIGDDKYTTHKLNAARAGLDFSAFHFGDPTKSVASQLAACLSVTQGVQKVALDIEAGNMSLTNGAAFIGGLRSAGKIAGLYHSLSGYPWDLGQDFDWLAYWGSATPPGPWEFWQYRGSPLDLDYFRGTRADLDTFTHGSYIAPDTSTGAAMTIPVSMDGPFDINLTVGDQLFDQNFQPAVKCTLAQTVRGYFTTGTGFYSISAIITADQRPQMLFVKIVDVTGSPTAPDCATATAPLTAQVASLTTMLDTTQAVLAKERAALDRAQALAVQITQI